MAQNVRPGHYDPTFQQRVNPPSDDPETERTRVRWGDLLVTIVGANTGDVCQFDRDVEDHYVCQSVALIRPCSETYGRYLNLYFQAERGGQRQYKRYIYGAGRPHLSFDQLRQTVIALPPEKEAEEILERAEELMSDIGKVASDLLQQPQYSAALRQAILAAAFSGRLVPQDPADEPASVLLARIRAERAHATAKPAKRPATSRRRRERSPQLSFSIEE
jgi:type I restriction enzyme S subunit